MFRIIPVVETLCQGQGEQQAAKREAESPKAFSSSYLKLPELCSCLRSSRPRRSSASVGDAAGAPWA